MNMKYKLYKGDCLEVMKNIPSKSVDMVLCDLPYGTTKCKWDVIITMNDYININNKNIENDEFYLQRFIKGLTQKEIDKIWKENKQEGLWTHYNRIVKDNGVIALFGKQPFTTYLINSNRKMFKYELIWEKDKPTNFALANKQPMCYHENILIFYKNQPIYNKQMVRREGKGTWRYEFDISHENRTIQGTDRKYKGKKEKSNYDKDFKNPKSILYYDTGKRQQLLHPTQKPILLCEWLIKTYSNEGDIILDNCMGSGTTGAGCRNLNRKFIGIELDENYFNIAKKRIEDAEEELKNN